MARCLLRGQQPVDARRLLSPFLLDEARQQDVPAPLRNGVRCLVALAFAQETSHPATSKVDNDRLVPFSSATLLVPFYFDEIGAVAKAREEKTVETLAPPSSLQKNANPAETVVLRIEQAEQPVAALLDRLAADAGMRTEWTAGSQEASGRSHAAALVAKLVARVDLLDQIADRFDLVCQIDGDAIRYSMADQTDAKQAAQARLNATKRALRAALLADAAHPWAPAVLLELGNSEADHGKSAKAVIWYERLIRNYPASPQVAPACFNLARLHQRNQEHVLARQTWFRVIDQLPGHELALRAYMRIAQSYLEEENAREAVILLRRAAEPLPPGSPYRSITPLLLAAAHLQLDEPDKSSIILAKQARRVDQGARQGDGRVFGCLCAISPGEARRWQSPRRDRIAQLHLARPGGQPPGADRAQLHCPRLSRSGLLSIRPSKPLAAAADASVQAAPM